MFPDPTTCNSYQQKTDKVKYTVQFGITPYLKDIILNEPFSFGETTTSQIKKTVQWLCNLPLKTFWLNCNSLFVNTFCWEMHW